MTSFARKELDPLWLAAALLGSVWAAAEIVLGSFLHNLSIPFTGTLLAAIGTSVVVAGAHIWGLRGLIWRSGLVCALMKSVSPSAVILGPMIGIILEAAAIELSIRLLGRNPVGYVIGGVAAVAMPLLQKIAGVVIIYGWDMTRLYVAAFDATARFLGFTALGPVELLLSLLGLHATLGAGATTFLTMSIPVRGSRFCCLSSILASWPEHWRH
jgi:hypothetical protein